MATVTQSANVVKITRGPDGDVVKVNDIVIPGATFMFRDSHKVIISIQAADIFVTAAKPTPRRITLEQDE